ncbi:MAG TPA: ABC transporter ATP-binding protein [Bellilinea sp.]|jgi:ABC-2 type transport system ATP-binding protein|nr:ABC transporter ATP-binding protein [Bellilinea sp.]
MILAEGLKKNFDDFAAVRGIDLTVDSGQVLALLGPNGAGKTTTIRMLTAVLTPSEGRALVAGYDVVRQSDQVRQSVGVLTEHHGLYNRMRAEEYLTFYGDIYNLPREVTRRQMINLLEQFGLADARSKKLGEYSKGMRQKLALVRALIHNPPVLLLDEPTSAMDPESARVVRDAIHQLRGQDRTIILCTHNLSEAEELADKIAIIRKGRIILQGTVENIKRELLGPEEYELRFSHAIAMTDLPQWPAGVRLDSSGTDWLRLQVDDARHSNPLLLRSLVEAGIPLLSFAPVSRSLEAAYLQAVHRAEEETTHDS